MTDQPHDNAGIHTAPSPCDEPRGRDTAQQMRSLADAVPSPNGGVRFQPIFPDTLRTWADEIDELRAAIAAMPAQSNGVRVKPLVWENFDAWTWWCKTEVGTYLVNERSAQWTAKRKHRENGEHYLSQDANTEVAAKAAAQADYERRILSALTPMPAPPVAEAAKVADDKADQYAKKAAMFHGRSNLYAHYNTLSRVSRRIADDIRALAQTAQEGGE